MYSERQKKSILKNKDKLKEDGGRFGGSDQKNIISKNNKFGKNFIENLKNYLTNNNYYDIIIHVRRKAEHNTQTTQSTKGKKLK